ncbi:MAG: dienelactone hydrolase family protein [Bryobacterales bacterium]|nr:dienelactone hydrolase family protein [Bryobacterales bacterium]
MAAEPVSQGNVRGFLHRPPTGEPSRALVMTHGAGGNAQGAMLVAMAELLAVRGWLVLRCDLVFRQRGKGGAPRPADSALDRAGLREAVGFIRTLAPPACRVTLGGHSYGGRQASMLVAEDATVANQLLLCSYPLHPPGQPAKLRTEHLPRIAVPTLFVHGTKDPFGSPDEMRAAVALVPGARLEFLQGAGHDLGKGRDLHFLDLL